MEGGKRYSHMTDTKEEGEAWELHARGALKLGKEVSTTSFKRVGGGDADTIGNILRSAKSLHWGKLRSGGTKQVFNAEAFVDFIGPKTPAKEALAIKNVRSFLETKHVANSTLNKYRSAISILRQTAGLPTDDLPWFKPEKGTARQRFFSREEERQVVELFDHWSRERERDLFMFLNDTGLRPWAEALPLTWKQVKFDRLVDIVGKSGDLRIVPLTTRAKLALDRQRALGLKGPWEGRNEYTLNGLWGRVRAALPVLDSDDNRWRTVWYTCRHTFASRMIQAGKPYGFVAKLMDNSVAMIEKVYGHLAPNHLKNAVDALETYGQGTPLSLVKNE